MANKVKLPDNKTFSIKFTGVQGGMLRSLGIYTTKENQFRAVPNDIVNQLR